jgi:ABC-type uncharacterized transport system permease subunit
MIHGASLLLATVSVSIGFVAGLMYLGQSRRLKHKLPPTRGLRLPSLEWLQRTNSRSLVVSLLMLGVGVVSGLTLNAIGRGNESGTVPWYDPVVLSTQVMFAWLLLSVLVGAFYKPARQGRKVAYLTLASFVFLLIALIAMLCFNTQHGGGRESQAAATADCAPTKPAAGGFA